VGTNLNVPQQTLIRKYQFRDDFSWTAGRHSLKFGANYIYLAKLGDFLLRRQRLPVDAVRYAFGDPEQSNPALYPQAC